MNKDQAEKYSIGENQRVVVREWYHIEVGNALRMNKILG